MIRFELNRFRERDWFEQAKKAHSLKLFSKSHKSLVGIRKQLNNKPFKSEHWFISLLMKDKRLDDLKCYLQYPLLNLYFVDFYFKKQCFAIDLKNNRSKTDYSFDRTENIRKAGFTFFEVSEFNETEANQAIDCLVSVVTKTTKNVT
ncbi:MAG TPA: hypothetical protein DCE71_07925 [Parachlamydiales bacterium]|nr:hypothetical protein [Parachlamydiales bacterium]